MDKFLTAVLAVLATILVIGTGAICYQGGRNSAGDDCRAIGKFRYLNQTFLCVQGPDSK